MIGQNLEKYLQMEWGNKMVFRDSLQFLDAFLKQLTASLAKTGRGNFYNVNEVVSQIYPGSDVELVERKGVFCYDYVDFFARLEEPDLPQQEAFFNKLGGVECSRPITPTPSKCTQIFSVRATWFIFSSTS